MELKKTPKNPKRFSCQKCQFLTCNKKDYTRHLLTRKHLKELNSINMETQKTPKCEKCNRIFASKSGLWKHTNNKCQDIVIHDDEDSDFTKKDVFSMFTEMMKKNQDLQNILVDKQEKNQFEQVQINKQLFELANETKVINHNSNNTINNRFNMNIFLNEQCKDAMNLSDFLNNIEVSLEDVSNVGRLGYADGISRIIINALKDMDVYERPIHCSDIKREIMYIKENDIWEKDDERKYQMKRVLKLISHKNVKRLLDWREAHPGWLVYDSKEEAECLRITNESMGGGSDEENERLYKKMIRKIAHETLIDKNLVE